MWKQVAYPNFGFKVFMDARMPVTHEEGDRYPLRPPNLFPMSNLGEGSGLLIREAWFESTMGSHFISEYSAVW